MRKFQASARGRRDHRSPVIDGENGPHATPRLREVDDSIDCPVDIGEIDRNVVANVRWKRFRNVERADYVQSHGASRFEKSIRPVGRRVHHQDH